METSLNRHEDTRNRYGCKAEKEMQDLHRGQAHGRVPVWMYATGTCNARTRGSPGGFGQSRGSNRGATQTMSRSLQGRRTARKAFRPDQVQRQPTRRGAFLASRRCTHSTPRLIGLPVTVTMPRLNGVRWRFCSRWDEQPAAELGKSFLRLGICRIEDWSGSAVDFVERGFRRFAKANGAEEAKRVWAGELRIADYLYPLSEPERNQLEADSDASIEKLFLIGEYHAAASIPIGATLS